MLTDCLTKTKLSLNGVNYKCLVPFVTTSEGVLAGSISVFFVQFLQSKRTTGISGMCLICLTQPTMSKHRWNVRVTHVIIMYGKPTSIYLPSEL